eukprot:937964_1
MTSDWLEECGGFSDDSTSLNIYTIYELWRTIVQYCNTLRRKNAVEQQELYTHPDSILDAFNALDIVPPSNRRDLDLFYKAYNEHFVAVGLETIGAKCTTFDPRFMPEPTKMVMVNDCEFIVAGEEDGLYKYNVQFNDFNLVVQYPDLLTVHDQGICFDSASQIVYLLCNEDEFITIDLKTKEIETHMGTDPSGNPIGCYPHLVMLDDECHIIGGSDNNRHLMWNKEKGEMEIIHTFSHLKGGISGQALIYIRSRHALFMCGCFAWRNNDLYDSIWKYDVIHRHWTQLNDVKLPRKMYDFGYVVDAQERYCILFGGMTDVGPVASVYIWDIRNMEFHESDIKVPAGRCEAVLLHNEADSVLIDGFVRSQCTSHSIHMSMEMELMVLIESYYKVQYVHINDTTNGYHYRISLYKLLDGVDAPTNKVSC